jgi:hypothetical protein
MNSVTYVCRLYTFLQICWFIIIITVVVVNLTITILNLPTIASN